MLHNNSDVTVSGLMSLDAPEVGRLSLPNISCSASVCGSRRDARYRGLYRDSG
jgi:hypothetical protein